MPPPLNSRRRADTVSPVKNFYRTKGAGGDDVSRPRKKLPAKPPDFASRFALRLREIMAENGWTSKDVSDRLKKHGVPISDRAVDVWMRGTSGPKFRDLEAVGRALGFKDYRDMLPPPE